MATTNTRYVNASNANSAGGTGITNDTSGTDRAFKTLSEWEAARAADLPGGDIIEEVICDSVDDADQIRVTVTGWTTDATRYISIKAAARSRASTKWSTTKYRMNWPSLHSTTALLFLSTDILYARISGIQFEYDVSNEDSASRIPYLLRFAPSANTSGSDIRLDGCHLRFVGTPGFTMTGNPGALGILYNPGISNSTPTPNFYVWNNIFSWEATGTWTNLVTGLRGEFRNQNVYMYNNTFKGAWSEGTSGNATGTPRIHYLKNNIFSGCTVATEGDHDNANCDYNSTNLSDLGYTAGSNDRVSQTFTFVAADDYAITGADAGARNWGVSDPGAGLFSTDIDGKTRSGTWDIGAFEYIPSGSFTRHYSNGAFQSADFVEVAGSFAAMRMFSNTTVQLGEIVEVATPPYRLYANGTYHSPQFIET
jgi:hypothetical protein